MRIVIATLHVRHSPQAVSLAGGCLLAALPENLRQGCQLMDLYPDQAVDTWQKTILANNPQLVAFSLYSWNRTQSLALGRRLKESRPDLLLLAGGPEATPDPLGVLQEGNLNGVITGEGEVIFEQLIVDLCNGSPPGVRSGLLWHTTTDQSAGKPAPPPLTELRSPWLSGVLQVPEHGGVLWETSRGCVYGCSYCFDARGHHGVRHYPEQRLADELEFFVKQHASRVWVLDSTFNSPPQRGKRLLRLLLQHAPQLHYHLEARAELLDAETISLLSQLRCSLQLGLQTIHTAALKHLQRHFEHESFCHACRMLNQHGVPFGIDLMYGLPGDSHSGFVDSLDFALEQRPDHLDIFPLAVLPGTELYRLRKELKLSAADKPPYQISSLPGYSAQQLQQSRELAEACDLFYNRGRAVGFLSSLSACLEMVGSDLLKAFSSWFKKRYKNDARRLDRDYPWTSSELLQLQLDYVHELLQEEQLAHLDMAFSDLIRFHHYHAETLLGPETPASTEPFPEDFTHRKFHCVASIQLVDFYYEIQDLLDMEASGLNVEAFVDLFRPVGSTALFIQREGEVACESLSDEFSLLLLNCREPNRVAHLVDEQLGDSEMTELLKLAWEEGLLNSPTAEAEGP